tara:strand:- start:273 stop:533 length:261 start_codon:yes stop_codon:yes gene_type:complete
MLINFLNNHLDYKINHDDKFIKKIILNTSFENLKRNESSEGFPEATKNSPFFRSGTKNQWQNILTSNQEKIISKSFHETMTKFNYK